MNRKSQQRRPLSLHPRTSSIGIDVSDHIIRSVLTHRRGDRADVVSSVEVALPEGLIQLGIITDHEQLRVLVREQLTSKLNHSKASVVVSLPESHSFIRTVTARPDQLQQEIQRHLPFPIDDVLIDTIDHGPVDEGDPTHVFSIAAVKTNVAQAYWDVFQGAGYHIRALEIESQGIARALYPSETGPDDAVAIIADIGRNHTTVLALQQHHIDFTHTTGVLSGKTLTDQIQQQLHCDEKEAERRKRESTEHNEDIAPLIKKYTADLAAELQRVIDFHSEHAPVHNSALEYRLITVGGGSHLLNLNEAVEDSVRHPIEHGQLAPGIICHSSVDVLSYLTAIGHSLRPFRPL